MLMKCYKIEIEMEYFEGTQAPKYRIAFTTQGDDLNKSDYGSFVIITPNFLTYSKYKIGKSYQIDIYKKE